MRSHGWRRSWVILWRVSSHGWEIRGGVVWLRIEAHRYGRRIVVVERVGPLPWYAIAHGGNHRSHGSHVHWTRIAIFSTMIFAVSIHRTRSGGVRSVEYFADVLLIHGIIICLGTIIWCAIILVVVILFFRELGAL
jgi:hypothetical protein